MINPDGVILGNSRTGAAGLDLNREFKSKNKSLFPEIGLLKRLVNKVLEKHEI
jgi:murein tripeptide amidase MpaA